MRDSKEKKNKKFIIIVILLFLIAIIWMFMSFFGNQSFYEYGENLFERLNSANEEYGEVSNSYNFSQYSCSSIVYSEGLLEFYDCEVEEDRKEAYCIYDGDNFDCNTGNKKVDITFNSDSNLDYNNKDINITLDYNNKDINITLDYDNAGIKSLLYCTATNKCVPDKEYSDDITLSENSNTNIVCVKAIYSDSSESDIVCSQNYIIDKIAPIINEPIIEGVIGNNGYYISDVVIKEIVAEDSISGIKETSANITSINYNTNGETIIIKAVDNAGNSTEKEIIIKVDKTDPTVGTMKFDGTVGLNGWFTSDLKISALPGLDNESGHGMTTINKKLIDQSVKSEVITLTTYDKAGNGVSVSQTVKVDKEGPVISGMTDIVVNVGEVIDLYTGVFATDFISGVNGSVVITSNNIDFNNSGEYSLTYKAIDYAGNETFATRKVVVDQNSLTVDFNANIHSDNNWYKEDIEVELDILETVTNINYCITSLDICTPNTSYIDKIDITNIGNNKICINADINNKESKVICSDFFKLDKEKPVLTNIKINNANPKEWYNVNTSVTSYDADDSLSGIKEVTFINREITNETAGDTITVKAVDNAGNETIETIVVKIDKTAPNITYTLGGNTHNNIWYFSDVDVNNLNATDSLSGTLSVSANKYKFTDETAGENLVLTAVDKAGNIATKTVSIKIDKTEPTINSYELNGTLVNGWYTTIVTLKDVIAVDSISGIDEDFLQQEINNFLIDYETTEEQVEFRVKDNAGHVKTAIFDIKVDLLKPNSGQIILDGDTNSTGDWYTSDVLITNTEGSDFISGVKETELNVKIIAKDGTDTTVNLSTKDNAGHETIATESINVDSTMPILESIEIFGDKLDNGWYVSDVKFGQVKAYDETSGIFESKIDVLEITENTVGTKVTIEITDNAGHELVITETIKIDKQIPTITSKGNINIENDQSVDVLDYFDYEFGISEGSVTCKLDGVEQVIITETLAVGEYDLECTAKSNAGLYSSASTKIVVTDDYEVLDYIEGDGSQFIDSGVSNTGDYIFEVEFLSTDLIKNTGSWIIGGRKDFNHSLGVHISSRGVYTGYGGRTIPYGPVIKEDVWHNLYFTRFGLNISGVNYKVPEQLIIPPANETEIRIGGNTVLASGEPDLRNFVGYMRSFKITDAVTGASIRDYIPVEMKLSHKVGLFDLVENKFYESDGTADYIPHYK